jgi:hypothetical protein
VAAYPRKSIGCYNIIPNPKDPYFFVKNDSDTRIQKLLVSENRKIWSSFGLGHGIDPGEQRKLFWKTSTNSQSCNQWMKAKFSDGSETAAVKFNFCEDLDTPIVFE